MRYQLEYHLHPHSLSVHVCILLTERPIRGIEHFEDLEGFEEPEKGEEWKEEKSPDWMGLIKDLLEIDGVADFEINRYEVLVIKGVLFEWDKAQIAKILGAIQFNFDPPGELEEAKPPIRHYVDERGISRTYVAEEPLSSSPQN